MSDYRWNVSDHAAAYDATAEHVHPHYTAMQDAILDLLALNADAQVLLVDLGGGSGRLAARVLERFPRARVVVIDQSEAFLALARQRLEPFGNRAAAIVCRIQDDWRAHLPGAVDAIVSMSAIHHLDGREKRELYGRCHAALRPGGVLLNGDEVRARSDGAYRAQLEAWAAHMRRLIDADVVPRPMHALLQSWAERNIGCFEKPKVSGDDCHETVDAQVDYVTAAGFANVDAPWQKELWAIMRGEKA